MLFQRGQIKFIGIRLGERLHEILFAREEPTAPIGIDGIVVARLISQASPRTSAGLLTGVSSIVPELPVLERLCIASRQTSSGSRPIRGGDQRRAEPLTSGFPGDSSD